MSAERFTMRWAMLFALFAALVAALPLLVSLLIHNSACFGTDHACRDMADVLGWRGRTLILILVLIPLMVAVAARGLAVGAFGWAMPFTLLMLMGSLPLLTTIGAPGQSEPIADALSQPAITPLLFLSVTLLALSAHPDDPGRSSRAWRTALGVVAAASLFVTAPLWLAGVQSLPQLERFAAPIAAKFAEWHTALGITPELGHLSYGCLIAYIVAAGGLGLSGGSERPARLARS